MQVTLFDRYTIDDKAGAKRTKDGYLVAFPRVARTGIQLYSGAELGIKDKKVVRVYRPASEVFDKQAMESLAHRPMTLDHPPEPVTSENWAKYATGQVGDTAMRDGEFVRVPMVLMDQQAINEYEAGKKQLSVGYSCDLVVEDGVVEEDGPWKGQAYDAVQRTIRGNHIAQCKAARGGDRLAIGDSGADTFTGDDNARNELMDAAIPLLVGSTMARVAIGERKVRYDAIKELSEGAKLVSLGDGYPIMVDGYVNAPLLKAARQRASGKSEQQIIKACDDLLALIGNDHVKTGDKAMKVVIVDGVSVSFDSEQSAQIVERALATKDAAIKQANDKAAADVKSVQDQLDAAQGTIKTLTADKDKLTGENAVLVQKVKDAEVGPEKLNEMVRDRETITGKAKAILGDKCPDLAKMTNDEIRKTVVDGKLGDGAKGFTADAYAAAFTAIAADVKVDGTAVNDARRVFAQQPQHQNGASFATDSASARKLKDEALRKRDEAQSNRWKGTTAAA